MLSPIVVEELNKAIIHWRQKVDELQNDLQSAEETVVHLEASLSACQAMVTPDEPRYGIHNHIDPRELAGAKTHKEALRMIAYRSGGLIKLADAARLVHKAGLSTAAKPSGVKSSLYGQLSTDDGWESEGEGTGIYRLLSYTPDLEKRDDESGDEQWPAESSPTGDGDASPRTCPANEATVVALGRIIV